MFSVVFLSMVPKLREKNIRLDLINTYQRIYLFVHAAEIGVRRKGNVHCKTGVRVIECRRVSTFWTFLSMYSTWQRTVQHILVLFNAHYHLLLLSPCLRDIAIVQRN